MTNVIGQVAGGTITNGQGCYGASLLPDTFKKILLTLAEDRCVQVIIIFKFSKNIANVKMSLSRPKFTVWSFSALRVDILSISVWPFLSNNSSFQATRCI